MWKTGISSIVGFLLVAHLHLCLAQLTVTPGDQEFSPHVSATCQAGIMTITVETGSPFTGIIHARDYRKKECLIPGTGETSSILRVNLYAKQNDSDYCGVVNKEQERSLPIAVRFHRTLELADDKFYVITCGRSGFRNSRNQSSDIYIKLLGENDRKITELVYGREYKLRVGMTNPDGIFGFRVTSCFGFSGRNGTAASQLIDKRGCPAKQVISAFEYSENKGWADAKIFSMFRFPFTSEVHIQCEVLICRGACGPPVCNDSDIADAETTKDPIDDKETATALGTTSAFVVDPSVEALVDCSGCGFQPPWLLYLCIAFGVLFLIMLIINIFLCSAMTCSCTRSEVIEKDPSIIDEYDPYRSWHGSQYGSRYSLNGVVPTKTNGYLSAASTVHSTRSYSTNSDHYAIVHSRPGSGYSPNGGRPIPPSRHRGPGSTGSNYSGKDMKY
ncbi:uncharacterized protein LOC136032965 [Artemia franciscana]|uniref:ZP domain-containing protein n=1 Tax=Artemia franciscana TaxID=6661 RepID=A0AA88ID06_ARTSF|nr:hypothetical protein QYM36_001039 [Artemia franciscana]